MPRETAAAELERLRLENEQLAESRRLADEARDAYAELYDSAPLPCLTLDATGTISRVNPAAAMLLGPINAGAKLTATRFKLLVRDADQPALAEYLRQCAGSREAVHVELRLRNGTPVRLWGRQLRPGARLYPTMIIDLREREDAERETRRLYEAEKVARSQSEAKDYFIATLSHELRTPLTPVLGAVTAFLNRVDVPEDLRDMARMISRNVQTEARLIDDLLDVTRIVQRKMSLELTPLDVHGVAVDAVETQSHLPRSAERISWWACSWRLNNGTSSPIL